MIELNLVCHDYDSFRASERKSCIFYPITSVTISTLVNHMPTFICSTRDYSKTYITIVV